MKFIQQIWNICLAKIFIWFHLNLIPKWHISPQQMIIPINSVVVFNMYCKISQVLTKGGLWVLPGSCY